MICDWQGMSFKFGGDCKQWYYENKGSKIILSSNTELIVEQLLDIYVDYLNKVVEQ